MPSRFAVAVILLFWLAVTGYVVRREVLPRYFADDPPRIDFVLVDELSTASTTWGVYRGDERIGGMTSRTEHVPADDTFRYLYTYRGLKLAIDRVSVEVPTGHLTVRLTRDGELREQVMSAKFEGKWEGLTAFTAAAEADGRVQDGQLVGRAKLDVPGLLKKPIDEPLTPVPVSAGGVLNPLMPADRLRGVSPGHRWTVSQANPMTDSLRLLVRKMLEEYKLNSKLFDGLFAAPPDLLAEVLAEPETLTRKGEAVECWVIRYESADKSITAKTYVRRDDGRVLRQEANGGGLNLRFERDDGP